ncbi:putative aminopeptidase W07G4.4 isoform X1 [Amyelois transitella]|uniref:putative aminopeptidase W07G4.4 isoform X1 n=1 Tax=Amyelois transitella TaxID=680683 RepID=UPI00298F54CD|nr:putative aminopeptidase W07G4.4 isoform X1 [Amyelois transitella]
MSESVEVHGCPVWVASELADARCDAVVVLLVPETPPPQALEDFIVAAQQLDAGLVKECAVLSCGRVSGGRLVLSPTGPLTAYDDVRSVAEAALAGVRRAVAAGARRPLLVLQPSARWRRAPLVALLAALEALYVPLQIRETFPERAERPQALAVYAEGVPAPARLLREAAALEAARGLARDIGGADPERATPLECAKLIQQSLRGGAVAVRVVDDRDVLEREYPLLAAVSRAADTVPRHRACVVFLEYTPAQYSETLMLVGKGVTYDTGGCDIKAGGAMAGMSRDKCGAAAVAGFFKDHECRVSAGTRPAARRRARGGRAGARAQLRGRGGLRQRRAAARARGRRRARGQHRRRGPPGHGGPARGDARACGRGEEPAPVHGGDADGPRAPRVRRRLHGGARQRGGAPRAPRGEAQRRRGGGRGPHGGVAPAPRGPARARGARGGRRAAPGGLAAVRSAAAWTSGPRGVPAAGGGAAGRAALHAPGRGRQRGRAARRAARRAAAGARRALRAHRRLTATNYTTHNIFTIIICVSLFLYDYIFLQLFI